MSRKFPLSYDPLKQLVIGGKTLDFDKLFKNYGYDAKPNVGTPLMVSVGAQERYTSAINHAVLKMIAEVDRELFSLFSSQEMNAHIKTLKGADAIGFDASNVGSAARILTNAFKRKFDKLFGALASELSVKMVSDINANSKQMLTQSVIKHPSLKEKSKALTLKIENLSESEKAMLKSAAAYSTNFIQSIPETYLNKVNDAVLNSIQSGNGLQDLKPFLDKVGNQTRNYAHNTAMDQTRKVFSNLNLSRMQKLGIKRGKWIHSGGSQHPRIRHQNYDGKSFSLADGAPVGDEGDSDYVQPGEEPNCRCTSSPILDDLFNDD